MERLSESARSKRVLHEPREHSNRCPRRAPSQLSIERKLAKELSILQERLGISRTLRVRWIPTKSVRSEINSGKLLHGETIDDTFYLYDDTLEEALYTLRHEVIERFIVEKSESDYVTLINRLIEAFNVVHRRQREDLVERLAQIV